MRYCDYLGVEDWEIMEVKTCHLFNQDETPFEALQVRIGTMTYHHTTVEGNVIDKYPIIRWITRKQYETLKQNSGVVVF